jgi:Acetyltransferase (GNAT) family.
MDLIYEKPKIQDYIGLRMRSGMGDKDFGRSQKAIENSLFTVSLYDQEQLIAFGRVVGDGGITYVVSDIMVDAKYWRRGFGDQIMAAIDTYLQENTFEDSYVCLIANKPADVLYHKYNFEYLPDHKCGMLRHQKA